VIDAHAPPGRRPAQTRPAPPAPPQKAAVPLGGGRQYVLTGKLYCRECAKKERKWKHSEPVKTGEVDLYQGLCKDHFLAGAGVGESVRPASTGARASALCASIARAPPPPVPPSPAPLRPVAGEERGGRHAVRGARGAGYGRDGAAEGGMSSAER
jgi:hypothetical protein